MVLLTIPGSDNNASVSNFVVWLQLIVHPRLNYVDFPFFTFTKSFDTPTSSPAVGFDHPNNTWLSAL